MCDRSNWRYYAKPKPPADESVSRGRLLAANIVLTLINLTLALIVLFR